MKFKLLFLIFCSLCFIASCTDENLEPLGNLRNAKVVEADACAQDEANMLNKEMLEALAVQTRGTTLKYPSFFGGTYITSNGNLVVLVKGSISFAKSHLGRNLLTDKVKFLTCQYSYNELDSIMNKIYAYMAGIKAVSIEHNLVGAAVIDEKNLIEVYLENCTTDEIETFKKCVIDSPAVVFKSVSKIENHSGLIELNPGSKLPLLNLYTESYGSFGFRAVEKSGKKRKGIVTAGHVVDVGNSFVIDKQIIGTCTQSCEGPYVDAAFVPVTYSDCILQNYFIGDTSKELAIQTSNPGAGTIINKQGATTNHTSGKIISTNAIQEFFGIVYNNLTKATYSCASGDSGGTVYSYISSKNMRYTVGILKEL